MSSSKTVNDRARSARQVLEAGREHAEAAGAMIAELLDPLREEGEPAVAWGQALRLLARAPSPLAETMVEADKALIAERQDDAPARGRRDAAEEEAYDLLVELRATAKTVYGDDGPTALGFSGPTPDRGIALLRSLEATRDNLPKLAELSVVGRGVSLNASVFAAPLEAVHRALDGALGTVDREQRELETAQNQKDDAVEAYDHLFLRATRSLEALLRLAGKDREADRVRPSLKRPGRTHLDPEDGAEGEAEGADGAEEAP